MVEVTPCIRLEIDGIDRTQPIWKYLESVSYDDAEDGESDSLSITVTNAPSFEMPKPGTKMRFWMGWESNIKYMGQFIVDEATVNVGSPLTMGITAKSANFTGQGTAKERKDREFENISLAGLAAKLAGEMGCVARVQVDVHYSHIAQTNESNMAFLQRLAAEAGAGLSIKDKTIVIYPPKMASRQEVSINSTEVTSGTFTAKAREEYGEVEARWWDKDEAEEKSVTATKKTEGKGGAKQVIKKRFNSAAEAKAAAENRMSKQERGELEANLTMPGNPAMVAGAKIKLSGFKPESLNGSYIAKSVSHSISSSGWTTSANLEKT